jgi:hypothetical protein
MAGADGIDCTTITAVYLHGLVLPQLQDSPRMPHIFRAPSSPISTCAQFIPQTFAKAHGKESIG